MDRKDFLSLNILSFFKIKPSNLPPVLKKINEDFYESFDTNTGEHITFSKINKFKDGKAIDDESCDGVIYVRIGSKYFKRNYSGALNVKWFGAKGDGIVDDTNAFNAALKCTPKSSYQEGGGAIYIPAGNYKITSSIIINQSQIKIWGAGIDLAFIEPTGKFDYAMQFSGFSYSNWLNAVELKNLTIKGKSFSGSGLRVENVGLRSIFENINIFNCGGKGIYCKSLFDHIYRNIEIRGCGDIGVHVFEQNKRTNPSLPFEENSFLVFDNVRPIANNKNGLQWLIQGGDSFRLVYCKPSEGSIGLRLDSLLSRCDISGLYIDGSGSGSVGIQIDDEFTRSVSIKNLSVFKVKYAVEVKNGRGINIEQIQIEAGDGGDISNAVYVHSTCVGEVYYDGYNDNYSNKFIDLSNSKLSTPFKFLGNQDAKGKIEKPLTAKLQTLSVNVNISAGNSCSKIKSVKLPVIFNEVYFIQATLKNSQEFLNYKTNQRNFSNLKAYVELYELNSINILVRELNPSFTLQEDLTVAIQILIIGEVKVL